MLHRLVRWCLPCSIVWYLNYPTPTDLNFVELRSARDVNFEYCSIIFTMRLHLSCLFWLLPWFWNSNYLNQIQIIWIFHHTSHHFLPEHTHTPYTTSGVGRRCNGACAHCIHYFASGGGWRCNGACGRGRCRQQLKYWTKKSLFRVRVQSSGEWSPDFLPHRDLMYMYVCVLSCADPNWLSESTCCSSARPLADRNSVHFGTMARVSHYHYYFALSCDDIMFLRPQVFLRWAKDQGFIILIQMAAFRHFVSPRPPRFQC